MAGGARGGVPGLRRAPGPRLQKGVLVPLVGLTHLPAAGAPLTWSAGPPSPSPPLQPERSSAGLEHGRV